MKYTINYGIILCDCINNNKKSNSRGEIRMNKTKLLKVFLSLILGAMLVFTTIPVNAAENFTDLSPTLNNTGNTNTGNTNIANTNSTNTNNSANTNRNTNSNSNSANTNRNSIYNNTNLPKTGIGDSLPIAALVVIFGISAVYAYKKVKDYRNI